MNSINLNPIIWFFIGAIVTFVFFLSISALLDLLSRINKIEKKLKIK